MSESVVVTRQLTVTFGAVTALDSVDLELPPGPVGLLGPNGAGKTTLLGVLLGHRTPDVGSVRVAGEDPRSGEGRLAIRRQVGYMPEGDCLIPRMNAVDLVSALGQFTGMRATDAMTRAHEVLDYVGLEESRYRDLAGYSVGMKQRLKLAQALVHDPPLILLDEPTNGLDPKGRAHMLELVEDLGQRHGKNVLLCSHLLPDVERTCSHVIVLNRGRVIRAGDIADMTRTEQHTVRVSVEGDEVAFKTSLDSSGLENDSSGGGRFSIQLGGEERDADAVFACAAEAGVVLTSVETVKRSLEDVFMSLLQEASEG